MSDSEFLEQMISYFQGLVRSQLRDTYGGWKSGNYANDFEDAFLKVYSKSVELMPDVQAKRHGVHPVFVLALEEVLRQEKVSFEDLKVHVLAIYENMLEQQIEYYKMQVESSEDPWKIITESMKVGNQQDYDNLYFDIEYVSDNDRELGFDLKRCLYFEIFEANGHPELGPILCEYDYLMTKALSKWSRFERTETIAEGSDRCDFRLYRI